MANKSGTPKPVSWGSSLWLALVALILFLAGIAAHALVAKFVAFPARYCATALFGALVGTTELVSRYRDKPTAPLGTWPGLIYIVTNAGASVAALWILQQKGVTFDLGGALPPEFGQVLLAGFGTMILFRSSLFTIRVGDSDVSIGPAAVLQIILNAADRALDRLRAGPRSERVYKIMRGVSFDRAKQTLPLHCFALMQNVSIAEQTQLIQTIDALATKPMTDEVKSYNLGLLMMNVVGEDVLEQAVNVLGPLILGPSTDEPPILAQAPVLKAEDTIALVDVCVALDPLGRTDRTAEQLKAEIKQAIADIGPIPVQNIVALMRLRERFGPTAVSRALALLSSSTVATVTPVKEKLTLADLQRTTSQPGAGIPPAGAATPPGAS